MGFILKLAASIYILSVLAFSSWSRATESYGFQAVTSGLNSIVPYGQNSSLKTIDETGTVLEEDGYLLFENNEGQASLIHSNSFALFEGVSLPAKVTLYGQSSKRALDPNNLSPVLQVTNVVFLDL